MRDYDDKRDWEQMLKERDEKDQQIALLKEQLRVADVAYQYLHEEHKKAQAYVEKMEHVLRNGGINPEAL
jgi:hypothetical protein